MNRKKINRKIIIITAVVLVAAVVVGVALPLFLNKQTNNFMLGNAGDAKEASTGYNVSFGEGFKYLFNSSDSVFAISSSDGKTIFTSHSKAAADNSLATILDIRLRDKKGNSYSMDSSANSVAAADFKIVSQDVNHINVVYELKPASTNGKLPVNELNVSIPVLFEFSHSKLKASVDISAITLSKGLYIENISLLPGLFSVESGAKNTYFTVPDGCGAQIDVGAVTEAPIVLDLNVYGEDVSFDPYSQGAVLPFFGIIRNGFSINSIIEDGDAISRITCKKDALGGGYLYNTFNVTPCGIVDGKFVHGESYDGIISQTYVVKDSGATYSSIAVQVRDSLNQRNYLATSLDGTFTDFPFFINVVGSNNGKNPLTTFEDAAEITALLKSRGVRSIALRVSGYGEKGLATSPDRVNSFSKALGGREGFSELSAAVNEQGNYLFVDSNIVADKSKTSLPVRIYDDVSKFAGYTPAKFSLSDSKVVDGRVADIYNFATEYENVSICLNDASKFLYTDLEGGKTRHEMLSLLKDEASTLSATGSLMLDYPAVYLMKETQAVFSTPITASCAGVNGVTSVPILQIVLHGGVVYGSIPINVSNLYADDALLKCVEYGCVPSFLFVHSENTPISYSSYATQTARLYSKAKQLMPLMNMKITSHELVTDGVYKITYDYSKVVYVNYNPSLVEVNGVMISEKDFVVI